MIFLRVIVAFLQDTGFFSLALVFLTWAPYVLVTSAVRSGQK